jgi:hypothetical protein
MPENPEISHSFEHLALPAAEQTDNSESDSERGKAMSTTTDASDPSNEILTITTNSESNSESNMNIKDDPPSTISSPSQIIPIPSAVDHSQTNASEEVTRGALSHDPSGTQIVYVEVRSPTTGAGGETFPLEEFSESPQNNLVAKSTSELSLTVNSAAMVDDDSEAGRSSQVDPDGAMPSHRSSLSRRFSEDELHSEDVLLFEEANVSSVDPSKSPPGTPPISPLAPLEIREVRPPENEEITLVPENLQAEQQQEPENLQIIEQAQEQSPVGLPYTRQGYIHSVERPHEYNNIPHDPHEYNNIPHESDNSILSTHTPSVASGSRQIEFSPAQVSAHLPPTVQTIAAIHQPPDRATPLFQPTLQRIPASAPTVPILPPAHAMLPQQHSVPVPAHANGYHPHFQTAAPIMPTMPTMPPSSIMMSNGGKRKIYLRLVEDVNTPQSRKGLFLFKRRSSRGILATPGAEMGTPDQPQTLGRGSVTVSWYEGTTSQELHEHVQNSVIRKLGLQGTVKMYDLRILDETTNPPEGKHSTVRHP